MVIGAIKEIADSKSVDTFRCDTVKASVNQTVLSPDGKMALKKRDQNNQAGI